MNNLTMLQLYVEIYNRITAHSTQIEFKATIQIGRSNIQMILQGRSTI
jgi:hypothetical protein